MHSKYNPSSSYRFLRCPASFTTEPDPLGESGSERTVQGDIAHAFISAWVPRIDQKTFNQDTIEEQTRIIGTWLEDAEKLTADKLRGNDELVYGLQYFTRVICAKISEYLEAGYHITRMVSELYMGDQITGGTSDLIILLKHEGDNFNTALIYDYKHGFGEIESSGVLPKAPHMKAQLLHYLWLCKNRFSSVDFKRYYGFIVQPFGNQMRGVVSGGEALETDLADFGDLLMASIASQKSDNPRMKPSGDACYRCPRRAVCPGFQKIFRQLHQLATA
jgi:CRISPR/Cas system-associated exonuclease Cas4 (RecB family)